MPTEKKHEDLVRRGDRRLEPRHVTFGPVDAARRTQMHNNADQLKAQLTGANASQLGCAEESRKTGTTPTVEIFEERKRQTNTVGWVTKGAALPTSREYVLTLKSLGCVASNKLQRAVSGCKQAASSCVGGSAQNRGFLKKGWPCKLDNEACDSGPLRQATMEESHHSPHCQDRRVTPDGSSALRPRYIVNERVAVCENTGTAQGVENFSQKKTG
jgi:hypothetical protein